MEAQNLIEALLTSEAHSFSLLQLVLAILLSSGLTIPTAWVYRYTQSHNNFAPSFVQSLFLFSSLTSVFTLLIGNNVAKAFGLIGALSIIRFRNALKEPIDAVYIFWALAIGMACGSGLFVEAAVTTILCGIIAIILSFTGAGESYYQEALVKFNGSSKAMNPDEIEKLFKNHSKNFHRIKGQYDNSDSESEWTYALKTKGSSSCDQIEEKLADQHGISKVKIIRQPNGLFLD